MRSNCGNGFRSQFASIPRVVVWAVPGALATLTSEVGTYLGGLVLGEDICGPDIMFGKKEHAHVRDRVLAAGLLALGGSTFVLSSGVEGSRFASWC
jgi:hypothetical protein